MNITNKWFFFLFLSFFAYIGFEQHLLGVIEQETEIYSFKTGDTYRMIFNDVDLFTDYSMLSSYNTTFAEIYGTLKWNAWNKYLIESLKKHKTNPTEAIDHFFHAITTLKDDNYADEPLYTCAFIFGEFDSDSRKSLTVERLGTLPEFEGHGFAWQLLWSIFEQYPEVETIELYALGTAEPFYKAHGFTHIEMGKYQLTRTTAITMQEKKQCKLRNAMHYKTWKFLHSAWSI